MKSSIPRLGAIPPNVRMGISLGEAQAKRNYSRSDWKPKKEDFKKSKPKREKMVFRKATVDVFNELEKFLVIVELPHHGTEKDFQCDVEERTLIVESNLFGFNFIERIQLLPDILTESIQKSFNNGILAISFKKKPRKVK